LFLRKGGGEIMKKLAKITAALGGASSGILALTSAAAADIIITDATSGTLPNFTVENFITWLIKIIIIAAFVISFIFLLIGGIRWIIAGGEEKAIASARGMVTGALIGLVIVLSAFAIIKLIETFFGVIIISGTIKIPVIGGSAVPTPIP
jgi:hypothetical protein